MKQIQLKIIEEFTKNLSKDKHWKNLTINQQALFNRFINQKENKPIGNYKQCYDYLNCLYRLFLDTIRITKDNHISKN